jgi:hypothetical protein
MLDSVRPSVSVNVSQLIGRVLVHVVLGDHVRASRLGTTELSALGKIQLITMKAFVDSQCIPNLYI